jgi:hypothetical protein
MWMQRIVGLGAGVLVGSMAWAGAAHAACSADTCAQEKIERLYVQGDGDIAISTTGPETDLNCTPEGDMYILLRRNHVAFNEIYSALLGAKLSKHDVWIRVAGGGGECTVSYLVLE